VSGGLEADDLVVVGSRGAKAVRGGGGP
jgi:hypothetical protein